MLGQFIEREIRRTNRNLLVLCGGTLAVVLFVFALNWRYYYNYFTGPFPMEPAALAQISDAKQETRRFLSVHGGRMLPTGIQEITVTKSKYTNREKSRRTSAHYGALIVGSKLLIVKTKSQSEGSDFQGEIVPIPGDIRSRLLSKATMQAAFLPYMLDASSYRTVGTVGLVFGALFLAIAGIGLARALKRRADPSQHPLALRLQALGEPAALGSTLDAEAGVQVEQPTYGPVQLTPSFLFRRNKLSLDLCLLSDLVWVHGKVTQHRTNGIPTGKTFVAVVHDRHRTSFELPCRKDHVLSELLAELARRAPFALFGHSADLEKAWGAKPQEIIEAVAKRRAAAAGAGPA